MALPAEGARHLSLPFAYCHRKLPEGLGGTSRLASTESAKKVLPDSHLWDASHQSTRLPVGIWQTTDSCPAFLSLGLQCAAPSSPRSAGASMSTPCPSALSEPSWIVLPALERGLPFIFSGRKCNA
ncbi:hypothetical protein MC885_012900 [Smutsia gigantea]|nr:hypothetical protein MC885_012900 [Smutsia gigantea]